MSLIQTTVTVGTSPTLLILSRLGGSQVRIINGNGNAVMVGAANVTASSGRRLQAFDEIVYNPPTTTAFYGVVNNGTQQVTIHEITTEEQ